MLSLKKLWLVLFLFLTFFTVKTSIAYAQKPVYLTFFYSKTCSHCADEKVFLEKLDKKYDFLAIRQFEVGEYGDLFAKTSRELGKQAVSVPFTVIGNEVVIGYLNDKTTGKQIEDIILRHSKIGCSDVVGEILANEGLAVEAAEESCDSDKSEEQGLNITLPVFGQINTIDLSLPLLTVLFGFLDGFNPCAMWVLLFLISLLLGLKDRRKLFILGSTFIFVSGLVYFLFMTAWLNIFLVLGFITWIRILVGLAAIISGVVYVRKYWLEKTGCVASGKDKRQKIFAKMQNIIHTQSFWLALAGIVVLAVSVNMLELVCSAGLPAIYTQVLSMSALPVWQYYLYLFLYILVFMMDDLLVFLIAVKTMHAVGISAKFSRYLSLIGGIVVFILGLLLIFKPEWVMFA